MPRQNAALARLHTVRKWVQRRLRAILRWWPVAVGVAILLALLIVYAATTRSELAQVTISTGTEGGTYFALGKVIAETLNQSDPPVTARAVQSDGAGDNARLVRSGANFIGFVQSNTPVTRDVKLLARLYPEVFHLLARGDRGIAGVGDLKGKRVALLPEGAGSNAAFFALLEHYQVSTNSIQPVPGTLQQGLKALEAGEVDALFAVVGLGNDAVAQSVRNANIQLLGIDQAQAIALFDPALKRMEIPKGVYSGDKPVPPRAIDVLSVDALLVANRAMPEDVVGAIVASLYERRQEMVKASPQAAFISQPTTQQQLAMAMHPGAEDYYQRNRPPLVVEYAEPIGLAVSVLVLLASGLWQARIWLSNARKNRADRYNIQIAALVDQAEQANSLDTLEAVRRELFAIFHEVIADLDNDRIDEASLQSFSFVWDVAQSTLSQRQLMLAGQGGTPKHNGGAHKTSAKD